MKTGRHRVNGREGKIWKTVDGETERKSYKDLESLNSCNYYYSYKKESAAP